MIDTLIVLPTFNEGETINNIVASLKKYPVDILVIDDCSTDKGCEKLEEIFFIKVIKNNKNLGYEKSLSKGLKFAIREGGKTVGAGVVSEIIE